MWLGAVLQAALPAAQRLLAAARAAGLMIVHTLEAHKPDLSGGPLLVCVLCLVHTLTRCLRHRAFFAARCMCTGVSGWCA